MRRTELDLCRFASCIMVVIVHAGSELYSSCPLYSTNLPGLTFILTLFHGCLPVFFMLTGTLMLSRETLDTRKFFNSHVLRLILLFLFWSVFYAVGSGLTGEGISLNYQFFLSIARGHYHLWFLTAMVTCGLFLPVVHAAIHKGQLEHKYLLLLFFGYIMLMKNFNLTPKTALILYQITLNFSLEYLGYLGYAVWGWWLNHHSFGKKWLYIAPVGFVACAIAASYGNIWYSNMKGVADGWLFDNFSVPIFVEATMIFCFFQALKGHSFKHPKLWATLSDCTLGVYLLHPMGLSVLNKLGIGPSLESPIGSLLLASAAVSVLCFGASFVMKKIPIIRKLI